MVIYQKYRMLNRFDLDSFLKQVFETKLNMWNNGSMKLKYYSQILFNHSWLRALSDVTTTWQAIFPY